MIDIIPVSGSPAPSVTIKAFGYSIHLAPVLKYLKIFALMPLTGGDKANRAVSMDLIVPAYKLSHPASGTLNAFKSALRVIRPVFTRSEKCLRIRVVIADMRSAERGHDSQGLQFGVKRKALLGYTLSYLLRNPSHRFPLVLVENT
jgi:hypothetical protein